MQNTKDTFYITLRTRLAAVNPARTMTLRAVTRPGMLVGEAELRCPSDADTFHADLDRFRGRSAAARDPRPDDCELQTSTAGTQARRGTRSWPLPRRNWTTKCSSFCIRTRHKSEPTRRIRPPLWETWSSGPSCVTPS